MIVLRAPKTGGAAESQAQGAGRNGCQLAMGDAGKCNVRINKDKQSSSHANHPPRERVFRRRDALSRVLDIQVSLYIHHLSSSMVKLINMPTGNISI